MLCRNHIDIAEGVRRCARCGTPFCPDCLVELSGRPYCATCKAEQLLDFRSGVDRSTIQLASILKRFGAKFIDLLIIAVPFYSVVAILAFTPAMRGQDFLLWSNFLGIPFAFLYLIYEGLMLQFRNGQTLGKMAMKLRVVRPDGSPISPGQAWGRSGMDALLFSCCFLVDYIPAFVTPDKTALHDMVAKTRVVET